jgi:hypothetical protein
MEADDSYVLHLATAAPTELQWALQVEAVPVGELERCKGSTCHLEPELGATVIM